MSNRYCHQLHKKQPRRLREGDFGSDRDLNRLPPPHDSSSGGDSVCCLSAIPRVSFRSNSFTIHRPSPILVQKMSIPGHGDSNSSGISTSTRLPDACITRPCHGSRLVYNETRGIQRDTLYTCTFMTTVETHIHPIFQHIISQTKNNV